MSIPLDNNKPYDHRAFTALPTFFANPDAAENEDQHRHNLTQKASISKAERYRDLTCPRQKGLKLYPIWATEISEFKRYGLGTMLYFKFLKQFGFIFLFLFFCSLPSLIFNLSGNGLSNTSFKLSATTLGNQGDMYTGDDSNILGLDRKMIGIIMSLSDLFYTLVFLIFLVWIQYSHRKEVKLYNYEISTVSQYTVSIYNLPKTCTDRYYLREFFSKYGKVIDVSIAYNNYELIKLFQKRGQLKKELVAAEVNNRKGRVKSLNKKVKKLDKEIDQWQSSHSIEARVAYIVFDRQEYAENCLKDYPNSFWHKLFMPKHKKLFSTHKPIVEHASEPSNIVYHHLQYSPRNKRFRRLGTFLATLCLISISTTIVYLASYYQSRIPQTADCSLNGSPTVWNSHLTKDQVYCYCAGLSTTDLLSQNGKCDDYIAAFALRSALIFVTATSTVFVNVAIEFFTRRISQLERHSSRSSQQRGIANKLSWGLFINTGLIILLVNANLTPFLGTDLRLRFLFSGDFTDFVSEWYEVVGNSIMITMLINVLTPTVFSFLACFVDECRRRKCLNIDSNSKITQEKLNKSYAGRKFELSARYAVIISNIYVTLMYSSGMPILLLFASTGFFCKYWMDKYTFLRNYRTPPRYDSALDSMTVQRIFPAVVLHSIMAVWFYSSPCTESYVVNQITVNEVVSNVKLPILAIQNRLLQWNALPFSILALLLVFYYAFKGVFQFFCCTGGSSHQVHHNFNSPINSPRGGPSPIDIPESTVDVTTLPSLPTKKSYRKSYFEASAEIRFESYKLNKQPEFRTAYLITKSLLQMAPEDDFSDVRPLFEDLKANQRDNEINVIATPPPPEVNKNLKNISSTYNKGIKLNQVVPVNESAVQMAIQEGEEEDEDSDDEQVPINKDNVKPEDNNNVTSTNTDPNKVASADGSTPNPPDSLSPPSPSAPSAPMVNRWFDRTKSIQFHSDSKIEEEKQHSRRDSELAHSAQLALHGINSAQYGEGTQIPFVCDQCSSQFLIIDHGVQAQYTCPYCKYQFVI